MEILTKTFYVIIMKFTVNIILELSVAKVVCFVPAASQFFTDLRTVLAKLKANKTWSLSIIEVPLLLV